MVINEFPSEFSQWARHWNYRHHAGIWRAELRRRDLPDPAPTAAEGVVAMLAGLWAVRDKIRSTTTDVYYNGQRHDLSGGIFEIVGELRAASVQSSDYLYVESDIDLALFWQRGEVLRASWFPNAGTLTLGEETDEFNGDAGPGLRFWELTVHPNVFTPEVAVITGYHYFGGLSVVSDQWPAAAYENRCLINRLLAEIMNATGLTVTEWESDLVDGVVMDGFADSARPKE